MSLYRVETFRGRGGAAFWRVVANNGQTLVASESYVSRWSATRTARKIAKGLNCELRRV